VEARLSAVEREFEADRPDLTDATKFLWREWPVHEGYVANDEGLVACRIYKTLRRGACGTVIMTSTYDFAEPGFILIDRVNEMNNNWWCENIRAQPLRHADTRLATASAWCVLGDLYERAMDIQATSGRRARRRGREGLVARMFSHHQLLFISLTRSMRMNPGSAKS